MVKDLVYCDDDHHRLVFEVGRQWHAVSFFWLSMRFLPTHFICLHTLDQNMIHALADILANVLEVVDFIISMYLHRNQIQ